MPKTVPASMPTTTSGRAPRRDAVRNDARVLQAAREVLGESGPQVSMEEIAARAGVGVGTIYRRFASKEALIDALVGLVMADLTRAAEDALAAPDGSGLHGFLITLGESFSLHRRYAGLMLGRGDEAGSERIRGYIEELTRRAVAAGALGPTVAAGDVMTLIWSLRALVEMAGDTAPDAWRRHLDIHLAGLRGPGSLSPVSAVTADQVRRISAVPAPGALRG